METLTTKKITKELVLQEIVDHYNKKQVYVRRKGKQLVPKSINDLPPMITKSVSRPYKKAYNRLYYKMFEATKRLGKKQKTTTTKSSSKTITKPRMQGKSLVSFEFEGVRFTVNKESKELKINLL